LRFTRAPLTLDHMKPILLAFALCAPTAAAALSTLSPASTSDNPCNSAPGGVFPDVAVFEGHAWCAVDQGANLAIVEVDNLSRVLREIDRPIAEPGLAFPRLGIGDDKLWVAYRDGSTGYLVDLSEGGETSSLGLVGGNDPFAMGYGYLAYQDEKNFTIHRRPLNGSGQVTLGPGRPTGLSRILPSGQVTLVDDDRVQAIGTRPCWADDLETAEGAQGGVMVARAGQTMMLWPGHVTFTPRCAHGEGENGEGIYAVATWGEKQARMYVFTDFSQASADQPELVWTNPLDGTGVGSLRGPSVTLTGLVAKPSDALGVEIWANNQGLEPLAKIGDATLDKQTGAWTYVLDTSHFSGHRANLRAVLDRASGDPLKYTVAADVDAGAN